MNGKPDMSIKIGALTWELCNVEPGAVQSDHDNADEDLWGLCLHSRQELRVSKHLTNQVWALTALHEVLHAILASAGVQAHDEVLIDALSHRLFELVRENPDFIEYLQNVENID